VEVTSSSKHEGDNLQTDIEDIRTYEDVVVVVVMTSPSGTAYMGGQRCPEEMRNSTRL